MNSLCYIYTYVTVSANNVLKTLKQNFDEKLLSSRTCGVGHGIVHYITSSYMCEIYYKHSEGNFLLA